MNLKLLFLTLGLMIFAQVGIFGQTSSAKFTEIEFDIRDLSQQGQSAYETLITTQIFSVNGYGIASAPYPQTLALHNLLAEKNVEKALQSVIRNAQPEGQVYGLLGLQVIKSKQFKSDLMVFRNLFSEKENLKLEINSNSGGCIDFAIKLKRTGVINDLKNGSLAKRFRFRFH